MAGWRRSCSGYRPLARGARRPRPPGVITRSTPTTWWPATARPSWQRCCWTGCADTWGAGVVPTPAHASRVIAVRPPARPYHLHAVPTRCSGAWQVKASLPLFYTHMNPRAGCPSGGLHKFPCVVSENRRIPKTIDVSPEGPLVDCFRAPRRFSRRFPRPKGLGAMLIYEVP